MRAMHQSPRRTPIERWLGLDAPTHRVRTHRGLTVPATDGTLLRATRLVPVGVGRGPVVLIRTPYARDSPVWMNLLPRPIARRGLQVVVQSVRGTFGSTGTFAPGRHERSDGTATFDWLRAQPWCDGRVAMVGGSYLATTQWAVGPYLDEPLSAMCLAIGSSTMLGGWYPQGSLGLDQTLRWATLLATQERRLGSLALLLGGRRIARALAAPDHAHADRAGIGEDSAVYQEIVAHADDPDYWVGAIDHSVARGALSTPTSMVTGWYDLFLRDQLVDHQAQVAAGHDSRLLIGPWSHSSTKLLPHQAHDALEFLDHTLRGRPLTRTSPVRIFVNGARGSSDEGRGQWRDLPAWPPPTQSLQLYLGSDLNGASIATFAEPATRTGQRSISYDPANPTPAAGGPTLNPPAGQHDQTTVEQRDDVLTHTTAPLDDDLEVIGTTTAHLHACTSDPSAVLLVRLCDVDARGTSRNVTEGLARLSPPNLDETAQPPAVEISLDPTAYVFRRGHRLRVQLAAGAHPRIINPRGGPYNVTLHDRPDLWPRVTLPLTTPAPPPRQQ